MIIARLLILSVALLGLPISEQAQVVNPRGLSHRDWYQEGNQADQSGDYATALKKLSDFRNINSEELKAYTSPKEIAFRHSLETTIDRIKGKIRQGKTDEKKRSSTTQAYGSKEGSDSSKGGSYGSTGGRDSSTGGRYGSTGGSDSSTGGRYGSEPASSQPAQEGSRSASPGTKTDRVAPDSSSNGLARTSTRGVETSEQDTRVKSLPGPTPPLLSRRVVESTIKPAEQIVRVKPAEQIVRVKPAEQIVRVKPAEQIVRVKPAEQIVRVKPAEQIVRVKPAEQIVRVKPAEQIVRIKPSEQIVRGVTNQSVRDVVNPNLSLKRTGTGP
jgi:hypothetical protein